MDLEAISQLTLQQTALEYSVRVAELAQNSYEQTATALLSQLTVEPSELIDTYA